MPLKEVESPADMLHTNQFVLEIEGVRYGSFSKVDGMSFGTGTTERADGGTGRKYKFTDGVLNVEPMTWTRIVDPSDARDAEIDDIFTSSITNGTKYNGTMIKYHHGSEVHRYLFYGLLFTKETLPSLDKVAAAPYEITYNVECDGYEKAAAAA